MNSKANERAYEPSISTPCYREALSVTGKDKACLWYSPLIHPGIGGTHLHARGHKKDSEQPAVTGPVLAGSPTDTLAGETPLERGPRGPCEAKAKSEARATPTACCGHPENVRSNQPHASRQMGTNQKKTGWRVELRPESPYDGGPLLEKSDYCTEKSGAAGQRRSRHGGAAGARNSEGREKLGSYFF
ncbi:unnamed protein product [Calypogeia fissa]